MIKKYVYGEPFETEALTENIETAEGKPGYGEICAEDGFSFTYIMDEEDIVYGLGESNRGIAHIGDSFLFFHNVYHVVWRFFIHFAAVGICIT